MSIEAMKQALEALETYHGYIEPLTTVFGGPRVPAEQSTTGKVERAITSLRQAIEQAEKQEPVAQAFESTCSETLRAQGKPYPRTCKKCGLGPCVGKSQREWQSLTDEEIDQGLLRSDYALQTAHAWRAGVVFAMTQLKEKNT